MKKKITYLILLAFVESISLFAQQMPLFTNYLFNPYVYNPAVAGSKPYVQANMNYRNQWMGFEGAPQTYMASIYGPLRKNKNVALGGMISTDLTGLLQRTSGYFTYAYHVKLNDKWKLGMGLSAGAMQYRVRLYDVRAYDKDDELLTGNLLTKIVFDCNAGLYLYRSNFFFGLSAYQAANNKVDFTNSQSRLAPHLYAMAGYTIRVNKKFDLQPSVLVKQTDPVPVQPEFSLRAIYQKIFWIGASYRMDDSYGFMIGAVCKERISIAYAYDLPFSGLHKYNGGSHELMLCYSFVKTKKQQDLDEEEFNNIDNSFKSNLRNKKKSEGEEK
jgi:type IX secretion system PorP/SprF family membrane protein